MWGSVAAKETEMVRKVRVCFCSTAYSEIVTCKITVVQLQPSTQDDAVNSLCPTRLRVQLVGRTTGLNVTRQSPCASFLGTQGTHNAA